MKILENKESDRRLNLKNNDNDQTADKVLDDYIARCQTYMTGSFPKETVEEFCVCTAAQMSQSFTEGQILTMAYGEGAPVDDTEFLLDIEAPCLYAPIGDLELNSCLYRSRYQNLFATFEIREMACQCIENEARDYMKEVGPELIRFYIEDIGFPDDPIMDIPKYIEYRKFIDEARRRCIGEYR